MIVTGFLNGSLLDLPLDNVDFFTDAVEDFGIVVQIYITCYKFRLAVVLLK